jgi:hypothetical protein
LRRIEAGLAVADPDLARRFRRWERSGGSDWTVVPCWMAVVFLVGFTTWAVAPAVGVAIAVVGCCRIARDWARQTEGRRERARSRDGRRRTAGPPSGP